MRITTLLLASLIASVPAAAAAQAADVAAVPAPSPAAAPTPTSPTPAPEASPAAAPAPVAAPVAAPATAPAPAAAPAVPAVEKPAERSGSYFGVSFGTGKGTVYSGSSSADIDDAFSLTGQAPTTLNLQLRFGWGTGDLLFGTQMNLTRTWVDVGGVSSGVQFFAFDLVTTWWSETAGLYTRLGVGPAQFNTFAGDSTSRTYNGMELMLGGGFTMGGMGVGLDFFRQVYDANETGFDAVSYLLATISLDMY
jgi:hypothetical protein